MFCGCSTAFGAAPNTQTCPVCLGMPGTLPVLNRRAVEFGVAHGARAAAARQRRAPLRAQALLLPGHAEELSDQPVRRAAGRGRAARGRASAGRHADASASSACTSKRTPASCARGHASRPRPPSLVDFNRAGVPLMEIVSKPDLRSPEEAAAYLRALRAILVYLGVCDGNMEEGSLRCDANVSLRPRGRDGARHQGRDQEPELVPQRAARARVRDRAPGAARSTPASASCRRRGSGTPTAAYTVSMRTKEHAHDYRYFPEPDLPPLERRQPAWTEEIRAGAARAAGAPRRERFVEPVRPARLRRRCS